jgi:carboxymethylenebutenolidase
MTTISAVSADRIELTVNDGTTMVAHVARPTALVKSGPGILVLQDAYGLTPFLTDICAKFADLGLTAIAPALYHRTGALEIPYDDIKMELTRPHQKAITASGMLADTAAAFDWLVSQGVASQRIAAIGFCMGGRLAYIANAHLPLAAAISLYGGGMQKFLDLAPKQRAPIMMMWAGLDEHVPLEQVRTVEDALMAAGVSHTQIMFAQAQHGFLCHSRPWLYDSAASGIAWAAILEMLSATKVL